jgi:PLP dependent protein
MSVRENLFLIRKQIPDHVKLVAVSKTQPNELIQEAYNCGQRIFGENKVQELLAKQSVLPTDIEWHFIGHLQTNKIKYIAPFISMIHGADSLKLLAEINKEAKKNNRVIPCLLEMYIAAEETKFGLDLDEAVEILSSDLFKTMHNIQISGVMGMATYTEDSNQIRQEFGKLHSFFETLQNRFFKNDAGFSEISMGMSGDFLLAIEEGSTMVRIGTSIFGDRQYH